MSIAKLAKRSVKAHRWGLKYKREHGVIYDFETGENNLKP